MTNRLGEDALFCRSLRLQVPWPGRTPLLATRNKLALLTQDFHSSKVLLLDTNGEDDIPDKSKVHTVYRHGRSAARRANSIELQPRRISSTKIQGMLLRSRRQILLR